MRGTAGGDEPEERALPDRVTSDSGLSSVTRQMLLRGAVLGAARLNASTSVVTPKPVGHLPKTASSACLMTVGTAASWSSQASFAAQG